MVRKNLDFYCFVTSSSLSLKNNVNISKKQKTLKTKFFCWHLADPYLKVSCTDPRIRIHTKMSRIHNTVCKYLSRYGRVYRKFLERKLRFRCTQTFITHQQILAGWLWSGFPRCERTPLPSPPPG